MNPDTLNHEQFLEQIPAVLAGGLHPDERAAFDAHAAMCESCAQALRDATEMDRSMNSLFAAVQPPADFEDRLVQRLRAPARPFNWLHPAVRRVAAGVAAAVILGATGYAGIHLMERGSLPGMSRSIALSESRTRQYARKSNEVTRYTGQDANAALYMGVTKGLAASENAPDGRASLQDSISTWSYTPAQDLTVQTLGEAAHGAKAGAAAAPAAAFFRPGDLNGRSLQQGLGAKNEGEVAEGAKDKSADVAGDRAAQGGDSYAKGQSAGRASGGGYGAGMMGGYGGGGYGGGGYGGGMGGGYGRVADAGDGDTRAKAGEGRVAADGRTSDPAAPASAAPPERTPPTTQAVNVRKIIRNGELEYEVDSFDSSTAQVTKIVGEEGGYVASSNSEKLPNGKVRGTIVLRVPPERLDTLVLKLRALGDLKSQRITSQDVTKSYYDLEGELKAARAMEERLLNIIKSGKGEIKDLLEAEKQLGVYREKIEKLEGEIRYYNNLVSLSTLSITMVERDIRTAAYAAQSENVSMGLETEDVEKARADAIKAVDDAKGRIVESNLKKFDAGQLAATLVCEVAPDAAGPLIDRLKQLGRVARLDIDRKQSAQGELRATANLPVQRKDTRLSISIYNLANIAPRQTNNVSLAVPNVEEGYRAILDLATKSKGRVISSVLNRQRTDQATATVNFEVPAADADAAMLELRRGREVMTLNVTENADTNNITTAKRGFVVQLFSLASVMPRQTEQIALAAKDVQSAYRSLLSVLNEANARIITSQLNEQDAQRVNARLDFEATSENRDRINKALADAGMVYSRSVSRAPDTQNAVDLKFRMQLNVVGIDQLPPRETTHMTVEVSNVDQRTAELRDAILKAGGRIVSGPRLTKEPSGQVSSAIVADVPVDRADPLRDLAQRMGTVRQQDSEPNPQAPEGALVRARLEVTLANSELLVGQDQGPWATFRRTVGTSIHGLLWSLQWILSGLVILIPWAMLAAIIWTVARHWRRKPPAETKPAPNP